MTITRNCPVPGRAGVGLRLPHLAEVVAARPPAAWLEIHPENFIANPHATELLIELSGHYRISLHTVGVSIGSVGGIDHSHLLRLRRLVDAIDPILVSGHLAWSTHDGAFLNDLLPLPYDEESLRLLAVHIDEVQEGLGRRYLVENPSRYVGFAHSTMNEVEFLSALAQRTGCLLLCDVSNVYLSAHNMRFDPYRYLEGLPADAIGEVHLGGFEAEADEADPSATVLIDTHAAKVAEPVWDLYACAVRRFGRKPTLIEWDNDLPPFATLLAEAKHADAVASLAASSQVCHACAG
ncbi:MAG: DUF692 domain-containing protein [Xanthobacteraceae bacterium]